MDSPQICHAVFKDEIWKQLEAFKILRERNPSLNPFILINNLEKIIDRSEQIPNPESNCDDAQIKNNSEWNEEEYVDIQDESLYRRARANKSKRGKDGRFLKGHGGQPKDREGRSSKGNRRRRVNREDGSSKRRFARKRLPYLDNLADNSLTIAKMVAADEHLEEWTEQLPNGSHRQRFKCLFCGKSNLPFRYNARLHVRRVHIKDRIPCPRCPLDFYNNVLLRKHQPHCSGRGRQKITFNANEHWNEFKSVTVRNEFSNFNLKHALLPIVRVEKMILPKNYYYSVPREPDFHDPMENPEQSLPVPSLTDTQLKEELDQMISGQQEQMAYQYPPPIIESREMDSNFEVSPQSMERILNLMEF